MTRRVATLSLAAAPLVLAKGKPRLACHTGAWRVAQSDFSSLLSAVTKIKDLKYNAFETSFRNLPFGPWAADHARQLSNVGLKLAAVWMENSNSNANGIPDEDLVDHVAKGCILYRVDRLIVHSRSNSSTRDMTGALAAAARMARRNSIELAYSPSARELAGDTLNTLLEQPEVKNLRLVFDTGEALKAGADLAEIFRRNQNRIDEVHLRDIREGEQVTLGTGTLDLTGLAKVIDAAGWSRWLVNVEDESQDASVGLPAVEKTRKAFGI